MISTWAAILFSAIALGVGLYLLAWHRGHVAGLSNRIDRLPVDPPWSPPGQAEFTEELQKARRDQHTPEKYRHEQH